MILWPVSDRLGASVRSRSNGGVRGFMPVGKLPQLRTALADGQDARLSISEINEILVQMYAYAGLPRCLNGIGTYMTSIQRIDERPNSAVDRISRTRIWAFAMGREEQTVTELRDDIAAAAERMGSSIGARKELSGLEEHLDDHERVDAMVAGDYGPGSGLLVLTDKRFLFVYDGITRHTVQDFPFSQVSTIQWTSGFNLGMVAIFAGGEVEIKGVDNDGGEIFVTAARHALDTYQSKL
jgi:hypothetical protein